MEQTNNNNKNDDNNIRLFRTEMHGPIGEPIKLMTKSRKRNGQQAHDYSKSKSKKYLPTMC